MQKIFEFIASLFESVAEKVCEEKDDGKRKRRKSNLS